jgi:hypothetical protein
MVSNLESVREKTPTEIGFREDCEVYGSTYGLGCFRSWAQCRARVVELIQTPNGNP